MIYTPISIFRVIIFATPRPVILDSLFFIAVLDMRNGTSTVLLLAMGTQSHIAIMLVPISSLNVIISVTLRPLPLQSLSSIVVLEMRSENLIWPLTMEPNSQVAVMLVPPPSPSKNHAHLKSHYQSSQIPSIEPASSNSPHPPCKPRRKQQSSTPLAPQPFP